ncbi:MAG: hypothetical protein HQ495_15540 [Alphaproteobacteria bacterium]|nr:hypothetical protein [Alphaproteobacteria bacterium]
MTKSDSGEDFLDLRFIFRIWVRWGWTALIFAGVGFYIGLQDARSQTAQYVASMVVMPESGSVGIGQSAGQLGSVLGISLPGGGSSETFDRFEVTLGSRKLAELLQEKYGLLQVVYGASWDAATKSWIAPSSESRAKQYRIRNLLGLPTPQWLPPSLETLASFVAGAVTFSTLKNGRFVRISIRHVDPEFALNLLQIVYDESDNLLRDSDLAESREKRKYIQRELGEANLVDSRQALIGILTGEERRAMLLETDLPYAARIIEPPSVSSQPEEPNYRVLIGLPTVIFGLVGLVLLTLVGLFRAE